MSSAQQGLDKGLLEAADRLLERSAEIRLLKIIDPAEARKLAAVIEGFEKRYVNFLAETDDIAKMRDVAKEAVLKFAALRADLKPGGRESGN